MPVPQLSQDSSALAGALLPLVVIKGTCVPSDFYVGRTPSSPKSRNVSGSSLQFCKSSVNQLARKTAANNMHKGSIW